MIHLKFSVELAALHIHAGFVGRGEENRGLGFSPAFLDFQTFTIYGSRFADGALAARTRLIPGFVRSGFFYTRRAALRAAREWVGS